MEGKRAFRNVHLIAAVVVIVLIKLLWREARQPDQVGPQPTPAAAPAPAASAPAANDPASGAAGLELLVRPPPDRQEADGIAVALLVDTSGSMGRAVRDSDGARRPKLDIAKRAGKRVVEKLRDFTDTHPGRPLKLGLYQFSGSAARRLGPFDLLDPERAVSDLEKLTLGSGTPIGEAMILGKRDLDRSGLTKKHLILLTDGENTEGRDPASVAAALASLPSEDQAGLYFIAFDVEASRFKAIKDAGGTVLEASSAPELDQCLDYILEKKILLELPDAPPPK
jgi:hypothetical protein